MYIFLQKWVLHILSTADGIRLPHPPTGLLCGLQLQHCCGCGLHGVSHQTVVISILSLPTRYRLIPLIPELREVMDWVFTDTALTLINWLRVQEIWAQIYQVKVRREREKVTSPAVDINHCVMIVGVSP